MTTEKNGENSSNCSTAGMGFAQTDRTKVASESCGLPSRGFATTTSADEKKVIKEHNPIVDCSTAGMGFARTDRTKIANENCAFPNKGFGTTDFGTKK